MKHYIVYNRETGEITRSGSCPDGDIAIQASEGQISAETERIYSDLDFYWNGDEVAARPEFDVEVQDNVLLGVPKGTTLTIEGETYTADGKRIEFEPSISGTYTIELRLFPFTPLTVEVTA